VDLPVGAEGSGCWGEVYVVAKFLELAHESAGVGGGVVSAGEPVGSEVLVDGVGFG
jgi:hypothetical protein